MPVEIGKPQFIRVRQFDSSVKNALIAVINVYRILDNPGSDKWHQVSRFRVKLYDMVCEEWATITGREPECFPFSEDYVVHRMYTAYRKTNLNIDNEVCDYLGIPRNQTKKSRRRRIVNIDEE